jgi:predicted porin
VSYDFGVAKLGGGVSSLTVMSGAVLNDAAVAVSVPVSSALTVGANYAQSSLGGTVVQTSIGITTAGQLDQNRSGYGLSAVYALSKRTSFIANYASWLPYGVGVAQRNEESNLLLSHSF